MREPFEPESRLLRYRISQVNLAAIEYGLLRAFPGARRPVLSELARRSNRLSGHRCPCLQARKFAV